MPSKLVYLACPYTHPTMEKQVERFLAVNRAAAKLMGDGVLIFSPISHTHPIAQAGKLPAHWEFWAAYDFEVLKNCYKIIVLKLDGWDKSTGVTAELRLAKELGLEIEYMEPEKHSEKVDNNQSDRYLIKRVAGMLGRIKTAKKAKASAANGKLGGRPKGRKNANSLRANSNRKPSL